jgi:two-component system response regulator DesR
MTTTTDPAARRPSDHYRELRVLLVHAEDLVHWGFRSVLTRQPWVEQLVGARDPTEAIEIVPRFRPHVAVIDLYFEGESGLDLCEQLVARYPETQLLILATESVPAPVREQVRLGGVVPKWWRAEDIASAVRSVGLGMTVFASELDDEDQLLSARDERILRMLAEGLTNREIAERLELSTHTVKDYVSGLYRKLEVHGRPAAIVRAQRLGLLG